MRKLLLIFILLTGMAACTLKSIPFRQPVSAKDAFFAAAVGQAKERCRLDSADQMARGMDMYRVRFREQRVEESNVLVWQNISENDSRFQKADTLSKGQDLILVRLHAVDPQEDVFIYYSMSMNGNNKFTGLGNGYLGRMGYENGVPAIYFYDRLLLDRDGNRLSIEGKSDRRSNKKVSKMGNLLYFKLADTLVRGAQNVDIKKVVVLETNKIGGTDPLFYTVDSIYGKNAMHMRKIR